MGDRFLNNVLSVVVGASCFFLLPDSPGTASWLKPDEARFVHENCPQARQAKVKPSALPARFVLACKDGHLDEFPYVEYVHRRKSCPKGVDGKLEFHDPGLNAGSAISIYCTCGAKRTMRDALKRADPEGIAAPMMITPGTDAKALALIGIPTYGFAPLRLDADTPFLSLFHAHDERVPVSAIAFGLPVLADVIDPLDAEQIPQLADIMTRMLTRLDPEGRMTIDAVRSALGDPGRQDGEDPADRDC